MVNFIYIIGMIGLALGLFWKPLGLPEWMEQAGPTIAIVAFAAMWIYRRKRNTVASPQNISSPQTRLQMVRKRKWLVIIAGFVSCLSAPFWLPYTGNVHLSVLGLWLDAAFSFLALLIICLFGFRRLENRLKAEDQQAQLPDSAH